MVWQVLHNAVIHPTLENTALFFWIPEWNGEKSMLVASSQTIIIIILKITPLGLVTKPTFQDTLRSRLKTTGITETVFDLVTDFPFYIVNFTPPL